MARAPGERLFSSLAVFQVNFVARSCRWCTALIATPRYVFAYLYFTRFVCSLHPYICSLYRGRVHRTRLGSYFDQRTGIYSCARYRETSKPCPTFENAHSNFASALHDCTYPWIAPINRIKSHRAFIWISSGCQFIRREPHSIESERDRNECEWKSERNSMCV